MREINRDEYEEGQEGIKTFTMTFKCLADVKAETVEQAILTLQNKLDEVWIEYEGDGPSVWLEDKQIVENTDWL